MRHYEIVMLIHPDPAHDAAELLQRYETLLKDKGASITRSENWGKRQLAYPIDKHIHKANYVLLNVSCESEVIDHLEENIRYNDSVIRHFVLVKPEAISTASPMMDKDAKGLRGKDLPAVTYMHLSTLNEHVLDTGRMVPRRITNVSALAQRRITTAIKHARFLALMPYCEHHG